MYTRCIIDRRGAFAVLLGAASLCMGIAFGAEQSARLTSLAEVHAISNAEAARAIPVAFEATVTYYQRGRSDLFVQDGDVAIYVAAPTTLNLRLGDRVLVKGTTEASYRPDIRANEVSFLRHGSPPAPVEAEYAPLIHAELDARRVEVRAIVRKARVETHGSYSDLLLDMAMPGGKLQAYVASNGAKVDVAALLNSEIEVIGAVTGEFAGRSQMSSIRLETAGLSDLQIVKPAGIDPNLLPIVPFRKLLPSPRFEDETQGVRVEGTVTYDQPGVAIVLQSGADALWIDTQDEERHNAGDKAIVTGFPMVRDGAVVLTDGIIQSSGPGSPITATEADATELASGAHRFELVTVEGQLISETYEKAQDQYVVISGGTVFSANYRHPGGSQNLPSKQVVRLGSRVRITGICAADQSAQLMSGTAFQLLLRSPRDVAVIAGPPLITVKSQGVVLALLLVAILVMIGIAFVLQRKLRGQVLATESAVERWQSRVIDGINHALPLTETLGQITELLAFKLQTKYCWAEIPDEGTFGNRPSDLALRQLHIVEYPILGHTGSSLGKIYVASLNSRRSGSDANAAEHVIRLAALAIETGERYGELIRRTELDPLTNTRNRFAFERALDSAIEEGASSGCRFGLFYIDLDRFKEVNDEFGHNIGDRYLQEAASRLRHRLRSDDLLARIGGDEFAILIPGLLNRQEILSIASRLLSCFNSPFSFER